PMRSVFKYFLDREKNRRRWKIIFVFEKLLIGGKDRKIVARSVIKRAIKRIYSVTGFFLLSPYRPKGIIRSIEQWIKDSLPPEMEGSCVKVIIPAETIFLKSPINVKEDHPAFKRGNKFYSSPAACLYFFKNASIVNENGVVMSSDGKVFAELTSQFGIFIEQNEIFKSYINKPQLRKECFATITSSDNRGYFHWIFDSLPRLKLLEDVFDEIDYLIVPHNLKRFHIETLSLLGFTDDKLFKIKDGTHLKCENLYVPSLPVGAAAMSRWVCEYLRDSFLPENPVEPYRMIYISRKDAIYRKIINENEVKEYLNGIGFETLQMSGLHFTEQVKIYSEARIIVSPHGAGLTNTVFCQKAKILELISPSYVGGFSKLASQVGNEYYYLMGEDAPGNSPPQWRDFKINLDELKRTLNIMLKK
ncbi:MAG TPA: glycosyltransferase family 61 protein, partial [Candidatus Methylomirabilis sp.]|nr:glycosyltransferase family 61 protein [Candidatus Methylomirabilis sp.]